MDRKSFLDPLLFFFEQREDEKGGGIAQDSSKTEQITRHTYKN